MPAPFCVGKGSFMFHLFNSRMQTGFNWLCNFSKKATRHILIATAFLLVLIIMISVLAFPLYQLYIHNVGITIWMASLGIPFFAKIVLMISALLALFITLDMLSQVIIKWLCQAILIADQKWLKPRLDP